MKRLVIDSSVAIKWIFEEPGTQEAAQLPGRYRLIAPDLLVAEFTNILSTKLRFGEYDLDRAERAVEIVNGAGIDFRPMSDLLVPALRIAHRLQHPAYDCFYLALALAERCPLVTADERFLRKLSQHPATEYAAVCISLTQAASA